MMIPNDLDEEGTHPDPQEHWATCRLDGPRPLPRPRYDVDAGQTYRYTPVRRVGPGEPDPLGWQRETPWTIVGIAVLRMAWKSHDDVQYYIQPATLTGHPAHDRVLHVWEAQLTPWVDAP